MSSSDDVWKDISEAKLPDVKTNMQAQFRFSFVQFLQNLTQDTVNGKVSYQYYYEALDNMEKAIQFFKNIAIVKEDDNYAGKEWKYRR